MNSLEKFAYKSGANNNNMKVRSNKWDGAGFIKKCILCNRMRKVGLKKFGLCNSCYNWCYRWIEKKYGKYSRLKLHEAMSAYNEPSYCNYCGKKLEIVKGQTRKRNRKLDVCDTCKKIYKKAYGDIQNLKLRSGRYRKSENI